MAWGDYRTVDEFTVTVKVIITEYDRNDGTKVYDWVSDGIEGAEWFPTLEDARRDAQHHFG